MIDRAGTGDHPLRALFVCTGNVCRSPVAERLLRHRLASSSNVVARSAGIHALAGQPIDGPSADALRELGVDPDGHVARHLSDEILVDADLVLVAEVRHRGDVLTRAPHLLRRTFTILEFARLATEADEASPDADVQHRLDAVAARRGRAGPSSGDDIADPYQRPLVQARACVGQIDAAVTTLARVLDGTGPR